MLVLTRKTQEAFELPDVDVLVRVLRCSPSNVQIGIQAPLAIRILRSELHNNDLRTLPGESGQSQQQASRLVRRLESQLAALDGLAGGVELSAVDGAHLTSLVLEEAHETLRQLRRQLVVSQCRDIPSVETRSQGQAKAVTGSVATSVPENVASDRVRQSNSVYAVSA